MAYTVPKSAIIDYAPEAMAAFPVYGFEYIDNLHFILPPNHVLSEPAPYIEAARAAFLSAGWEGDGEIGLLWLPPFVFPLESQRPWLGVTAWHVKQLEDGISWLLSPVELPFGEFAKWLRPNSN
jgi:hypothetical protein